MEKLKMLAGAGPTRVVAHERAAREARPEVSAFAEHSAETLEAEELDEALETSLLATSDPMQRLMVLQMKQLSLLSRQIQSRQPADPIQAVLGSGSSDSNGGSTSGIKGCLAREAFVKISEDLLKLAEVAQANALNELGRTSTQNTPGLMRDYLEQRVPLGNFKQLTQFGYLAAAAWKIGNRTSNKELQGFAAKMLMFIEQRAMDNGKSNLGWLMTGLPDPNFALVHQHQHRSGMKPFTRLAAASWVAANVSYLRDLDFLETKIRNTDRPEKGAAGGGIKEGDDKRPQPKRPPKKGKPKGSDAGAGDASSAPAGN